MKRDYREFLEELKDSYDYHTEELFPDIELLWFEENESLFIRGSDSFMDWIFNFMSFPDTLVGLHFGFKYKADRIYNYCYNNNINPTTVVGHSAGGAIAQVLGWYWGCEVYALACPTTCMVGNKNELMNSFLRWADKNLVLINQEKDIITKLPLWGKHPIEPLWLNNSDYSLFAHSLISFE